MRGWIWWQLILFQLLWLSAVVGGNAWLLMTLLLLGVQFWLSPSRSLDERVAPLALLGIAADALLVWVGVFHFEQIPLWLGLLWLGFVFSLGHGLIWLRRLPLWLLMLLGAVAGSSSYLAGWKLEAVALPLGVGVTLVVLALLWALLLPLLVWVDQRLREVS